MFDLVSVVYRGRTVDISTRLMVCVVLILCVVVGCASFIILSSVQYADKIDSLQKELIVAKTLNQRLTKEIQQSHDRVAEITKNLTGKSSDVYTKFYHDVDSTDISSFYVAMSDMHSNLEKLDIYLNNKVSIVRSFVHLTNTSKFPVIHNVIGGFNIADSIHANERSSSVRKASKNNDVTFNTKAISSLIYKIGVKVKNLRSMYSFISELPLETPLTDGRFVSGFGVRLHPIHHKKMHHKGADFSGARDSKVVSTGHGVVESAGYNAGFGNYVVIHHKNNIKTLYAHMKKIFVRRGQKVKSGHIVGVQGSTGTSTGDHVHYEVFVNGAHIDPLNFIRARSLLN